MRFPTPRATANRKAHRRKSTHSLELGNLCSCANPCHHRAHRSILKQFSQASHKSTFNLTASFARRQAAGVPAYTTGCHACCFSAVELPLRSRKDNVSGYEPSGCPRFRLAASDVLHPRRLAVHAFVIRHLRFVAWSRSSASAVSHAGSVVGCVCAGGCWSPPSASFATSALAHAASTASPSAARLAPSHEPLCGSQKYKRPAAFRRQAARTQNLC